ncbi:TPR repeat protein [Variovorax paradoxus]|uniref:tetratricopeptide repeat protein n=1 Tax=Variovorax paradoxus TaxID=34073 RepID=UPI003390C3D8
MKDVMSRKHAASYLRGQGFSLPEQSADAHAWCLRLAQEGDVVAQCVLSVLFSVGLTGQRDEKLAFEWCEIAANNGSQDAKSALASHLISGRYVEHQPQRGIALLRELVEAGHVPAMVSLGVLMMSGHSEFLPKDEDAAFDLLLVPAQTGDPLSQCLIGAQLTLSDDPEVQLSGARWIASAAEGGLPMAHRYLANFYRHGIYGYPADPEKVAVHDAIAQRLEEACL